MYSPEMYATTTLDVDGIHPNPLAILAVPETYPCLPLNEMVKFLNSYKVPQNRSRPHE